MHYLNDSNTLTNVSLQDTSVVTEEAEEIKEALLKEQMMLKLVSCKPYHLSLGGQSEVAAKWDNLKTYLQIYFLPYL